MNTKLVLDIEEEIITTVKAYAKENGTSLSEIVENYFKLLTNDRKPLESEKLSPAVKKIRGRLPYKDSMNYKSILEEELNKKYGR